MVNYNYICVGCGDELETDGYKCRSCINNELEGQRMDKATLVAALIKADDARPRSKQTAIGVSQLGGCARQVWHKLKGDQGTNPTSRLAAIMGTAIHGAIENALGDTDALIEHRVEIDGLPPATIDYFNPATGEVVDWKTITVKNIPWFVSKQKRWQVQTYGYLLTKDGFDVKTVTLVGIPRDGNENDIIIHSEPYDEAVALEALAWLDQVKATETAPAPERDPNTFCAKYCEFYGSVCNGQTKDLTGDIITDPVAEKAAKTYVELSAQKKAIEAQLDGVKDALVGVPGVTMDGIKVSWSSVAGRKAPDLTTILELFQTHIDPTATELPSKVGEPSVRLNVK